MYYFLENLSSIIPWCKGILNAVISRQTLIDTLLGSLVGSSIGVFGVLYIAHWKINREKKEEEKERFNQLIVIMYEIRKNIKRCEFLMKKNQISFSTIRTPTYSNLVSQIKLSGLDLQVYVSIEKIYYLFEVVLYNIEKANVLKIETTKTEHTEKQIQKSHIDDERYRNGIAFIQEYLNSAYINYNIIHGIVKIYAQNHNFEFPESEDIDRYSSKHIIDKTIEYQLKNNTL